MEKNLFGYKEFFKHSRAVQQCIIENTFNEIYTEKPQLHSLQSIVAQNRMLAVGCRMIGRGTITMNGKEFTGKDVADVYIESVTKNTKCYYPLTGDWTETDVKQLILFVKTNGAYIPYARFDIDDIIKTDKQPANFNKYCVEPNFLNDFHYKTLLIISNVQTDNLPKSFIGVRSGMDIYDRAFHGSSPNILIL